MTSSVYGTAINVLYKLLISCKYSQYHTYSSYTVLSIVCAYANLLLLELVTSTEGLQEHVLQPLDHETALNS